ncbi:hypothetical protein [Microbacterium sp. No. 7]|uniref:hypothetical protein n=1 Tax=Microbacterium sp. No. 7 TaxID=1714373 RepID=UPI0006D1430C|nr:hypothetical protein [Microbacterium sp. No. 7]ALJ22062.1 hypothetical protein AOA12_20070 [Microbacterium sp. No. 7]
MAAENANPLQALDDAIHDYLRATSDVKDGTWITGWVLGISTSRIDSTDDTMRPRVTGAQYALGPQTSTTDATGLAAFLNVVMERATWAMLNNDEDDDDDD